MQLRFRRYESHYYHICLYSAGDEISKLLLEEAKLDPNAKNNDGNTPLHTAYRNEQYKAVQLLVRDERCNLNEKDGSGNTLLHWAVRHQDKELVQLLVRDERCNPHEKDIKGDTALHVACRFKFTGTV